MTGRTVRRRFVRRRLPASEPAHPRASMVVVQIRLTSPFDPTTVHAIAMRPGETRSLTIAALAREILAGVHPAEPATLVNVPIEVSARVT